MTTASKLTMLRVALVPVFIVLMLVGGEQTWAISLAVFIIASFTDFLDGYIARHYNQVSNFGKFMDPLADKLLVMSALIIFVAWHQIPSWAAIVIIAREFAVTGLRLIAVERGRVIAAGISGKIKTFSSLVFLCIMITPWHSVPLVGSFTVDDLGVLVMVVATVWSGTEYFARNSDVLKAEKS